MVPACTPDTAKSSLGCKILCLALFLPFHHLLIPQTFIEHLCAPGSVLSAGDTEEGGFCFLGAMALAVCFVAMLSDSITPMCSVVLCLVPLHLFPAPVSLPFLPLSNFSVFRTQGGYLPHGDFGIFGDSSFNSDLLGGDGVADLEGQRHGRSGEYK